MRFFEIIMGEKIYSVFSIIALLVGAIFAVRFSTLPQSWALLLIMFQAFCVITNILRGRTTVSSSMVLWVAIVGIIYFTIRAYFSLAIDLAVADMFIFSALAISFIVFSTQSYKHKYLTWVINTVAILVIINLLMYIPIINSLRDDLFGYAKGKWNTGLFGHRNFYSNFMAISSCVLLSHALLSRRSIKTKILLGFVGGGAAFSVFIAMARGGAVGWLAGVFTVCSCCFIFRPQAKRKSIKIIASVTVLLVLAVAFFAVNLVFKERNMEVSSDARMTYFSMAVDQIAEAPILGKGSRSIEYKSYQYWRPELYTDLDFKFTHNEFLQVTADYGLVGLLLMLVFMFTYIYTIGCKIMDALSRGQSITREVSGLSCLVVMVVNSLVSFPMHAFPNVLLLGIVLGVSLSPREKMADDLPRAIPNSKFTKFSLCASMLILLGFVTPYIIKENLASLAFLKQGLVTDDKNWDEKSLESLEWKNALIDSTKVSSTFSRENKLGYMYLRQYNKTGNTSFLKKAKVRFLIAKERHPEDPIARLNLGYIYQQSKEFEKSIAEYKQVEYMVIKRENQFKMLLDLIQVQVEYAEMKLHSGKEEEAIALLEEALVNCRRRSTMRISRSSRFYTEYERAILMYHKLTEGKIDKEKSYALVDEYIILCKKRSPHTEEDILVSMCLNLVMNARVAWLSNRDPQRAVNVLFIVSHRLYHLQQAHPDIVNYPKWKMAYQGLVKMRKIFNTAGFKAEVE